MDNVTHTLFAVTLGRTPLARAGRGVMPALILASNAPDLDFVSSAGGTLSYLHWHRGPTHGPLGVIGLGLLTASLVWTTRRIFARNAPPPSASFPALAGVSIAGVLLHILMDLPTQYGTRIFSPFEDLWYAVNWMPIVDVYLLALLTGGLLVGSWRAGWAPAAGREPARSRAAAIVLLLMLGNYALRASTHQAALDAAPDAFGAALPTPCADAPPSHVVQRWSRETALNPRPPHLPACLVEIVALPTFVSPFEWRVVARLSNAYEARALNLLDSRSTPPARRPEGAGARSAQRYPDEWTPAVLSAARSEVGLTFLGFARFPAARSTAAPDGSTLVQWTDVRFASDDVAGDAALTDRRRNFFTATVRVAPDGRILDSN
jgi:inner membrane protein